jgi:nucleoside 2-deoxyribosyltransferase
VVDCACLAGAHLLAPEDGPVASRLKAVAAAYGIRVLLPERLGPSPKRTLGSEATKLIRSADAVVARVTERATQSEWVMAELQAAEAAGKPIVALVEDDVVLDGKKARVPLHIVRFDRSNPASHEDALVGALNAIAEEAKAKRAAKAQRETAARREAAAVGAFAGIAIGLLALGAFALALSSDDEAGT